MALTSPGVQVTIDDQSQYLPAPTNSVPLVVLATAQNKADASGTGVAAATTAANAGKLYQVTSQRDLVNLYGTPFFYTTTNGTPIQGYELNEYGLLAAYSLLGATNRCYVLRANIDLASLVGQTGRPVGEPTTGTYWMDTTTSQWGIYEFNSSTGEFTLQTPIVLTDNTYMSAGAPVSSIGTIGDYAVYAPAISDPPGPGHSTYFHKTQDNIWVGIGSNGWYSDIPTITSNVSTTGGITGSFTLAINGASATITVPSAPNDTLAGIAGQINALGWGYISADVRNNRLFINSSQPVDQLAYITGADVVLPTWVSLTSISGNVLTILGVTSAQQYNQPAFVYGTSAQMPLWTASQTTPRPSGSVWIKIGSAGNGLSPVISEYNATTATWNAKNISYAEDDAIATAALDSTGGQAIPAGTIYTQYDYFGHVDSPLYTFVRAATGPTVATGTTTNWTLANLPGADTPFFVKITTPGSTTYSSSYQLLLNDGDGPEEFVTAWSAAQGYNNYGIPYTTCTVTTDGAIQITHTEGGSIILSDYLASDFGTGSQGTSTGVLETIGFVANETPFCKYGVSLYQYFNLTDNTAGDNNAVIRITPQFGDYQIALIVTAGTGYAVDDELTFPGTSLGGTSPAQDLVVKVTSVSGLGGITGLVYVSGSPVEDWTTEVSNWVALDYTPNEGALVVAPANNTNWFYSVVDEVDIMVNTSAGWRGYGNVDFDSNGFPLPSGTNETDPNGPIISASEPTTQSDGTALVYGDLWINTTDLENYPVINRWQAVSGVNQWVTLNNTDQVSSTGVLFADARWSSNQNTINPVDDPIPTIQSLLTSNNLDLDAPVASLYPVGMLLWNSRRSGYNVKQYRSNYFTLANFPGETLPTITSTWVTVSGNETNGSPYMGRKAQRAMVVAALRSVVDTNTDIRDEDNYFNLMATPNYPELQPNMIVLNVDRGETGYIIGDTPMRLPDSATDIQAWATNAAGAPATGEDGAVNRYEYMGLFYPSGLTADLSGNLVAVPPSHMMLRTFLRNDTISYPWLAAAGTRRGTIDNATNIGYVDATTGEFVTIKTRLGVRDVLYINNINPLVFFTGVGLLNYGNKSSKSTSSALDRTNVSRLIAYIRRQLTLASRPFVFEPNDALTRQQISGVVQTLMVDLVAKRGLYDYLVVCDESNNTPARIDRNELWIDVAVEPVKAAEFIYIPVRVLNTGELSQ